MRLKLKFFFRVHEEVSEISHNQTEAALRWTNIAQAIDEADRTAVTAAEKAEDAVAASRSNLMRKSQTALRHSNRVYSGVFTKQLAVESECESH